MITAKHLDGRTGLVTDAAVDRFCMILLAGEARRLRREIELTLAENAHLADGETCTLWRLKRALLPVSERSKTRGHERAN